MTGPGGAGDAGQRERLMTVVHVRALPDCTEVMFVESARFFRLQRGTPGYAEAQRKLQRAAGSGRPIRVRFDRPNGEIIERVD
jgi:hypothetical protein